MSLRYKITVSKDHDQVSADWDISCDMSDTQIIAKFALTIEGKEVDTECSGGNKACISSAFATLEKPDKDCHVTAAITTNGPEVVKKSGVLRGDKDLDDVEFAN